MKVRSRAVVFSAASLILVYILGSLFRFASVATVDYARQTGQPCGTCHVRPEGGGELDATGAAFAQGGYQWPIAEGIKPYTPSNLAKTLRLILGYVHLTVAVIWFGTIFYIHIVVRPQQIMTGIPKTQAILGWIGIATMAATGTGLAVLRHLETGSVFQGSFGAVFIIKLALFGIMVLLAFVATAILSRRMRATPEGQTSGPTSGNRTPETLAASSGEDGARAIFAVNGILYDVTESRLWRRGVHAGQHRAGQDLTEALKSAPHGDEVLQRVPRVGLLRAGPHTTGTQRRRVQRLFLGAAYANLVLSLGILFCVAWWKWGFAWDRRPVASPHGVALLSESSAECVACHTENEFMLSQISEWQRSAHAQEQVGCYECHHAEAGDPDAMDHNGYTVSVLVTPLDCGECHIRESEEFLASRHAQAGDILDSLDNILGERVEGVAAAVLGCQQCHGAPIEVQADGTLSAASWPNTGIGRINPDGSSGACSTCHTRHLFALEVGREPSSCGNCHMGPDHPQKEIYEESKHGVAFVANRDKMNLSADLWVLGEDYSAAPTCVTCHMGAVPGLEASHDVGLRIAWTLRPEVSVRLEDWEARRESMTQVCRQCHSPSFYTNYLSQFDDAVELYNVKFAKPALQIMQRLREAGKITALNFDEPIEWTYFYLWHHEGRRARHGAAMMGPDYVQWHGFYEVAERFYIEFVPEAEALLPGITEPFLQADHHEWRKASP